MSTVTISAADVNTLRQQTGAGMMDCRKALIESNGDFGIKILYIAGKNFICENNKIYHNNLIKMLKDFGYKSYRDWMKKTSDALGYKNVRAMRYYIEKNNKQKEVSFYNHKIVKIEWLENKMKEQK